MRPLPALLSSEVASYTRSPRRRQLVFPCRVSGAPPTITSQAKVGIRCMSLESFFHEVAIRQASADRDNLKSSPLGDWKKGLSILPPAVKWIGAIIVLTVVAAASWAARVPISQYLASSPSHPFGAAEVLATVTHHTSPATRARHLVLACAYENDAAACEEAFRQALTIVRPEEVISWLKEKEVRTLRVNAYFEQFASSLENYADRVRASWQGGGTSTKLNLWMPAETPLDLSAARQADSLRPTQQPAVTLPRGRSSAELASPRPK